MGSRPSSYVFTQEGPLRLYSTTELLNLPAPTWLVDKALPAGGLVGMYGRPGCGKSFIAIDLAMSIATGTPWFGREVERGFVIYISAEGGSGIGKRVLAWLATHGVEPRNADIAWLVESIPVSTDSTQMGQLLDRIVDEVRRHPALIIIDTLARCFDGDENLQEDMGRFIAGVDLLRKELGCTVLVVHHTRLDGNRERGNTSFRGAVDTMIAIDRSDDLIELKCNKQKDDEEFADIQLELVKVDGTDSCVVMPNHALVNEAQMLDEMVASLVQVQPCSWDTWRATTGFTQSKFMKAYQKVKASGRAKKDPATNLWKVVSL
jgi:KaiC/GvpD/RAD55 family RecA-like ATPase